MAGALYYLPVHVGWASSRRVKDDIAECVPIVIDALVNNPITLYEYCCAEDSLLTRWFRAHGHQAVRLTLPDNDMSKWP
eukprot:6923011-Heterocapsa_arctica.AAC.1